MTDLTLTTVTPNAGALAAPEVDALHVVFRVGDVHYALPADVVLQMEAYNGVTPVPGTLPFVAGIVPIRGRVVPLVDLRLRFGLPAAAPTFDTRIVLGQHADRAVALLVDSAREVVKLPAAAIKPPPRLLEEGASGFVRAVAQVGARTVLILDFAKVVGEETLHVV